MTAINYNSLGKTGVPFPQIYKERVREVKQIPTYRHMGENEKLFLTKECQLIKIEGMVIFEN